MFPVLMLYVIGLIHFFVQFENFSFIATGKGFGSCNFYQREIFFFLQMAEIENRINPSNIMSKP